MPDFTQMSLADVGGEASEEYAAFVEKFKPKKTTDDCYTPQNVYDALADWVAKEYGRDHEKFVRPFWPGGDYEHEEYPEGCTVVDNPPFSLMVQIKSFYAQHGIKFFLFCPSLTAFSGGIEDWCVISTDTDIMYENGAVVPTAFVTNLEDNICRTCPELHELLSEVNNRNVKATKRQLHKYVYPYDVLTAAALKKLAKYGQELVIKKGSAIFIRKLDSQAATGQTLFGGGLLLSERAAAERAAATVWKLSPRERELQKHLEANRDISAQ